MRVSTGREHDRLSQRRRLGSVRELVVNCIPEGTGKDHQDVLDEDSPIRPSQVQSLIALDLCTLRSGRSVNF